MNLLEKLKEDIKSGNFIFRNFGETDEKFRKRVIEKTLQKRQQE